MSCSNRFTLPGSPSTCTLDIAIAPLPSLLLLAGPLIFVPFFYGYSSRFEKYDGVSPPRWLHIAYTILVFLTFGMTVLEIARLVAEEAGFGLLPATSITLAIIFIVLIVQRHQRTLLVSVTLLFYWAFLVVVESIKVSRLHLLNALFPNKHSKYPSSDKLLDNFVMLGLYVVFLCIEAFTMYTIFRQRSSLRAKVWQV